MPMPETGKHYATLSDWLNEIEGFSLRLERVPDEAMPWIEEAWRLGHKAGAKMEHAACASIVDSLYHVIARPYTDPSPEFNSPAAVSELDASLVISAAEAIRSRDLEVE